MEGVVWIVFCTVALIMVGIYMWRIYTLKPKELTPLEEILEDIKVRQHVMGDGRVYFTIETISDNKQWYRLDKEGEPNRTHYESSDVQRALNDIIKQRLATTKISNKVLNTKEILSIKNLDEISSTGFASLDSKDIDAFIEESIRGKGRVAA